MAASVGLEVLEQAVPPDHLVAVAALHVAYRVHCRGGPPADGEPGRGPLGLRLGPPQRLPATTLLLVHGDAAARAAAEGVVLLLLARDQDERRGAVLVASHERAHVPGDAAEEEAGQRRGAGAAPAVALAPGELEDLEAVLGDGDAHAVEELVVEEDHVVGLQLVAREHQRVLVHQHRLQPRPRQPRVPVHARARGRRPVPSLAWLCHALWPAACRCACARALDLCRALAIVLGAGVYTEVMGVGKMAGRWNNCTFACRVGRMDIMGVIRTVRFSNPRSSGTARHSWCL